MAASLDVFKLAASGQQSSVVGCWQLDKDFGGSPTPEPFN
jgi:hypothetical protein